MMNYSVKKPCSLSGKNEALDYAPGSQDSALDPKLVLDTPSFPQKTGPTNTNSISISCLALNQMNSSPSATCPSTPVHQMPPCLHVPSTTVNVENILSLFQAEHLSDHMMSNIVHESCVLNDYSEEIKRLQSLAYSSTTDPVIVRNIVFDPEEGEYVFGEENAADESA
jgi:hypothetical protein